MTCRGRALKRWLSRRARQVGQGGPGEQPRQPPPLPAGGPRAVLAAGKPHSGRQTPRSRSFSLARPCLRSAEAHVMGTGLVPPSESARVGGPPPGAVGARARALGGRGLGRPSGSPWELSRGSALQGGPLGPAPPTVAGRPRPGCSQQPCTHPAHGRAAWTAEAAGTCPGEASPCRAQGGCARSSPSPWLLHSAPTRHLAWGPQLPDTDSWLGCG